MYTQENISIPAASGAAGMKGPSSGRRPGTTGNRGGDHSANGRTSRDAGECFAADHAVLRPVGLQGNSELGRPGASREEADISRLQGIRGGQTMGSGGVGEIAFRPGGLMQDPTQLQQMEQQQGKRQQMVLDGCGKEAEEECCGEDSRNGGAAACAAADKGSGRQRLPMVAAFSGRRVVRVRSGGTDSSNEESEDTDLDGGAAACAAAMGDEMLGEILREAGVCCGEDVRGWMESEAVTAEARNHWEIAQQNVWNRIAQLQEGAECSDAVVRAAGILWDEFDQMNWKGKAARFAAFTQGALGSGETDSEQTWEEELQDVDAEVRELEERLRVLGERQGELQEAVNEEAEALGLEWDLGRWQDAVNEGRWQDAENEDALRPVNEEALRQQEEI